MHKRFHLSKLNQSGFDHVFGAVLCFVAAGLVGTFMLVVSHAYTVHWKGLLEESSGSSGFCLTTNGSANGSSVALDPCNSTGSNTQSWSLNYTGHATVLGTSNVQEFTLQSANGTTECLNDPNGSKTNGVALQLYTCHSNDPNNLWVWGGSITGKNLAYHQLINVASSLCIDDAYGSHAAANKVQLWACKTSGQANQSWYEAKAGSGGSTSSSGAYKVVGNNIENASGQAIKIHGVDRPSTEWSCNGQSASGGPGPVPASDFTTMRSKWNANAVRIPMNQDFWLSGAAKYCSSYQSNIATEVKNAETAGLIVILDLHWSDQGNLANASPAQQCMADQNSVTFWQQVAAQYKSDPNVWFELYNEPHDITWSQWQNGGSACGYQTVGMQQLYNAVRGTGASNIVVAGGNSWASSLNGVPKLSGTNIAYAIHLYRQTASESFNAAGLDSQFDNTENSAPVIATEFGDQVCDGQPYVQDLLNYFRQHNVGYTAWAWYVSGCSFPSIISDAAGDCYGASTGCIIQKDMESYGTN